ncbi:translation elongation factor Ts [Rhabdochlamydiaceae symbiont of Dictyostelium giganteum]|uniref:translation elongation factor Ts n=1 Tax=Rhabdochlamydiaceae symbiont of Dictyostelium giganteum TaxID=3342349 RepID=UPI00384BC2E2
MTSIKITPEMVKILRERTGVGMGKCKEALDQASGDVEKAIDLLRKAGMASAVKKEGRETKEGVVVFTETPTHVAVVEINAETDFVVHNDRFKQFATEVVEQAARTNPSSLESFLSQKSDQDPSLSLDEYRAVVMQSIGENIKIKRLQIFAKTGHESFGIYSHLGGKIVTLVELSSPSQEMLAKEIAVHVAAEAPEYLNVEDIPADIKAREEEIARDQVKGKPEAVIGKIVAGKMDAFFDQVCLLRQRFIKDDSLTITNLLENASKETGHPVTLKQFIRWKVGE